MNMKEKHQAKGFSIQYNQGKQLSTEYCLG